MGRVRVRGQTIQFVLYKNPYECPHNDRCTNMRVYVSVCIRTQPRSRQSNASDTVRSTHEMSQRHLCHNTQIHVCGRERKSHTHTLSFSISQTKEQFSWNERGSCMDLGFRVIWDWDKHTEIRVCEKQTFNPCHCSEQVGCKWCAL